MEPFARTLFSREHDEFRRVFRRWLDNEVVPNHEIWEEERLVPRAVWQDAGSHGFLGYAVPDEFGGGGVDDYRFGAIMLEEIGDTGVIGSGLGFTLHNDVVLPYLTELATAEQKQRWLPKMVTGETIGAIAMTEPNAGSDLAGVKTTAVRTGDSFVVNGAKTFITNGINADLVIAVVRTAPEQGHRGISLLVMERGMAGFERGAALNKLGMHAQDTAELFFTDVVVPADNLLGEEGSGFVYLMRNLAQERLGLAVQAVAVAEAALRWTIEYVKSRTAFGQAVAQFQNTKFVLAELHTEVQAARVYTDRCIELHVERTLTAEQAAAAKWLTTELQNRVVDRCLQLHGGYGYIRDYPIARAWADARVQTIYGGTSEIMKEIVGRALVR